MVLVLLGLTVRWILLLVITTSGQWDFDFIRSIFFPSNADEILRVLIEGVDTHDKLACFHGPLVLETFNVRPDQNQRG